MIQFHEHIFQMGLNHQQGFHGTLMSNIDVYQNVQRSRGESSLECHKKIWKDMSKPCWSRFGFEGGRRARVWKWQLLKIFQVQQSIRFLKKSYSCFQNIWWGHLQECAWRDFCKGLEVLKSRQVLPRFRITDLQKGGWWVPFLFSLLFPFKRSTQSMDNNFFAKLQPQFGEIQVVKSTHQPCDRLLYFLIFG